MSCGDRQSVNIIVAAYRHMTAHALGHKSCIFAVGFQARPAPASPSPAVCTLIALGILVHQFDLYKIIWMDQAIWTKLLLPGNFCKARPIRPRRNVSRSHCLHRNIIPENETKCVVVAAIGEADWLPTFEIGIEQKSIELRLN